MTKRILNLCAFLLVFQVVSIAQEIDLRKLDIDRFKEICAKQFCKNGNSNSCTEKMKNLELVASYIKADERVTNLKLAAFFFATIAVETGIKNFNPTEEIGKGKGRNYGVVDKKTGQVYYGRGWVQLTHKGNYQNVSSIMRIDFVNKPELVLEPKNAYEILYLSTTKGWLETYRSNDKGAGGTIPIKVTDFIDNNGNLDYSLTRAVINANAVGKNPERFEYKKGCFIPRSEFLDASKENKKASIFFERALKYGLGIEAKDDAVKLLPLIEHNKTPSAGCFIRDDNGAIYCQLYSDEGFFFNLTGHEEQFEQIKDKKGFPKGYDYGFKKQDTTIFIKETILKKEGSYETNKYQIIIRIGGKEYRQTLSGFCGS